MNQDVAVSSVPVTPGLDIFHWDMRTGKKKLAKNIPDDSWDMFQVLGNKLVIFKEEGALKVFDGETLKVLWDFKAPKNNKKIVSVSVTSDGSMAATILSNGQVTLWRRPARGSTTPRLVRELISRPSSVREGNFLEDGKTFVGVGTLVISRMDDNNLITTTYKTQTHDSKVYFWNTDNGSLIRTWKGIGNQIPYGIFNKKSNVVVSENRDGTYKVWSAKNGQLIRTLAILSDSKSRTSQQAPIVNEWLSFSSRNRVLASPGARSRVLLRTGDHLQPVPPALLKSVPAVN
jgi:WD40 repeat protein